jgi:GDP-L-fucose synthase
MVVPSLIKRALSGQQELVVWGDGRPVRDFIHSRDVARGMMLIAEQSPNEPVNLGSGSGYSIRNLVECIVENMDNPLKVIWDTSKPNGDLLRLMDTAKARKYGFEVQISLKEGVKDVMDWYTANKNKTNTRYDVFDQRG